MLKKAPLTFVGLGIICLASGILLARWYDSDKLNDKNDQIHRYEIALGIQPGSPNALVELTNSELRSKALLLSSKARALCDEFNRRSLEIKGQLDAKKIDEKNAITQQRALRKDFSSQFDRDLRSDALNVQNELLRRLDPKATASVVRFPVFADAATGTPISLFSLIPGAEADFLCGFAGELEQLADLLPSR